MAQAGYTPILIYASSTPGALPSAGNLTSSASGAELAINYADGKLYFKNSSGVVTLLAGSSSGPAGGSNTQVQYNSSGVLAGSSNMTFDGTSLTLGGNPTLSAGTANGVLYLNGSKVATSGSALTFDGTNLGVTGSTNGLLTTTITNSNTGSSARAGIVINSDSADLSMFAASAAYTGVSGWADTGIISTGSATSGGMLFNVQLASPVYRFMYLATNELMRLDSTGLGIGTSSPGSLTAGGNNLVVGGGSGNTGMSIYSGTTGVGAIYFADGTTGADAYRGWFEYKHNTNNFSIGTNGSERAVLDSSGNLGLGVTPSANWAGVTALQLNAAGSLSSTNLYTAMQNGLVATSAGYAWKYLTSSYGLAYLQNNFNGQHQWYTAASGTAGNVASPTQAMTLDADGDLGLGTTSPNTYANYHTFTINGTSGGEIDFQDGGTTRGQIYSESTGMTITSLGATFLKFGTNGTERARITSGGYFKASNTGGYDNVNGTFHELLNNDSGDPVVQLIHFGATSPNGIKLDFTAASPDDNTQYFLRCADSTAARCFIYSDGDLANHDGVYGTISDQRLKQDIVDAGSQWADIKAIRFRKYRMKSDVAANPNAPALLGVVAQELEQVSPGLVDEHFDADGEVTKTVKSSILLMKAAVALQEAMARIETLEAKVSALEGN